jgi:four helix bundle protein
MAESIVKHKSYDFALRIIKLCAWLKDQKHFEIGTQLLRSGTSIGANVEEALAGQSRKDFLAKMSLASKEARETNYWLRLIRDSGMLNGDRIQAIIDESEELCKILTSIVKTGNAKTKSVPTKNSKLKTKN